MSATLSGVITNDDGSTISITADSVVLTTHPAPPPPRARVLLGLNSSAASAFTNLGVVRRYAGAGAPAPANVLSAVQTDAKAGAHTILSFGPQVAGNPYKPANMEPYRQAIETPSVWGVPWHEPENDNVTPQDWRAFYSAFCQQFPKCVVVLPVLMGWTFDQGKASNWLNGLPRMDFVGTDPYVHNGQTVAQSWDASRKWAEAAHKQLVIAETGALSNNPAVNQAQVLAAMAAYITQYPSIYAAAYWSQVGKTPYDWTLKGNAIPAFQSLLKSPPFSADA